MRSKTLVLKGGMSIDSKRSRFRSAMADPELKAIHVKDEEFTYGGDDGEVLQCMIDLVRKNRDWKTIKLENCKGRIDCAIW